ncbi:MAG: hypothetical protein K8T90_20160 [Planctomycetes bacterium]|nr:hypothetical protein [Planctomycetota bacterium]
MRARINTSNYRLDFEGSPSFWNDLLRPFLGGPAAVPDPVVATEPAGAAAASTAFHGEPVVRTVASAPSPVAPTTYHSAPPTPVAGRGSPSPAVATAPGVRTYFPPREPRPERADGSERPGKAPRGNRFDRAREQQPHDDSDQRPPWRRRGGPAPEARVAPSMDPTELYGRLGAVDSRGAEKDAVIAAVWFIGKGEREVHEKEVEAHFAAHGGPPDVKVRPVFLKHISRSKLLEAGTQTGLVRLSAKGREHVRLLCGV